MRNIITTIKRLGSMTGITVTSAIISFVLLVAFLALPQGGNHKILIVLSGSMEPTISAGSLLFVQQAPVTKAVTPLTHPRYTTGDVISFNLPKAKQFVTHRIVSVSNQDGSWVYKTKGDANSQVDSFVVSESQVLGSVTGSIPYIGRLMGFAKTKQGIGVLILIPALFVLISELVFLFTKVRSRFTFGWKLPVRSEAFFLVGLIFGVTTMVGSTQAFLSDTAASSENIFQAIDSFGPNSGDVVINEIMWMGSQGNASDEWIELRNMTGSSIDISNWVVENLATGPGGNITIPSGNNIGPNGFFVIGNDVASTSILSVEPDYQTSAVSLQNPGEQLVLKTSGGTTIDTAASNVDGWFAGDDNPEKSMERNDIPGDGTVAGSWHTATGQTNIDAGTDELATPKATNSLP